MRGLVTLLFSALQDSLQCMKGDFLPISPSFNKPNVLLMKPFFCPANYGVLILILYVCVRLVVLSVAQQAVQGRKR